MMNAAPQRNRRPLQIVYGTYCWLAFASGALAASLCAAVLPGLERRRRWVGGCARGFFSAAGIRVDIHGLEHLPDDASVVVANHASYLDGVLLQGFLPPRFSYVIKSEMRKIPLAHFLLRRIGSRFVERFVASASARDARGLLRAAGTGESLAFFPEGTFVAEAGLGRFHPGAFATAVKGAVPLVPVVIRGSREVLPAGASLPRRHPIRIDVLPLIPPQHDAFAKHKTLAEEARRRILPVLGEPDSRRSG